MTSLRLTRDGRPRMSLAGCGEVTSRSIRRECRSAPLLCVAVQSKILYFVYENTENVKDYRLRDSLAHSGCGTDKKNFVDARVRKNPISYISPPGLYKD